MTVCTQEHYYAYKCYIATASINSYLSAIVHKKILSTSVNGDHISTGIIN